MAMAENDPVLFLPVTKIRVGEAAIFKIRHAPVERHELLALRGRAAVFSNTAFDDAEDGRVRADAERQRERGHPVKPGFFINVRAP